jgi:hypothetical protein
MRDAPIIIADHIGNSRLRNLRIAVKERTKRKMRIAMMSLGGSNP